MKKENSVKTEEKEEVVVKGSNHVVRTVLAIAIVLFFILITIISLRAQYINSLQVGENFTTIVTNNMKTHYSIALVMFVISYFTIYINNKISKRGIKKFFDEDSISMPKLPNKTIALIIAVLVFIIMPSIVEKDFTMFVNGGWFGGDHDPIFNQDIGFYLFKLPFVELMLKVAIISNAFLILYTAIYYVVILNTNLNGVSKDTIKKNTMIKQIIFFIACIVILVAFYIWFYSMSILTQDMVYSNMELTGAGSTDVTVKLWGYRLLCFIIIVSVVGIFIAIKRKSFKQGFISALIVPVYLVVLFIVMTYHQVVYLGQNQLDKEKSYIEYNINNTKKAYGINIEQKTIDDYGTITQEQIANNAELLKDIPIISKDTILKMVQNQQDNGVYYSYRDTNLAKYNFMGEEEIVYITPREILSGFEMSLNNRTYKYTHGYSVVVNTSNDSNLDGYSEYLLSDYQNRIGNTVINQPRIYFGLHTNSTIAVNSIYGKEYDYPITATTYEEYSYDGEAGLRLNIWDRLAVGLTTGQISLALARNINDTTKIISNRNILERAKSILPYVEYDTNPYLVINSSGGLTWVIDGYTVSNKYPYSQITEVTGLDGRNKKINYIRNSVKVLVDAYNGTTKFYITDKTDPIIMLYNNMYPDLFTDGDIPVDISSHFTYPAYLYKVQSELIATYHDISSDSLYREDDLWQITPTVVGTKSSTALEPTFTNYKLPDGQEGFGLVLTYNKRGKQNIIAYLVGSIENGSPKLSLYKYSSENNIVGISQLNAQIEQDVTINKELEKLNATGTKLTREVKIIPIENTLLYIEPIYQVMLNDPEDIPVLKKVIVASGNKIAIGDDFVSSLNGLFTSYVDIQFNDPNDMGSIIDSLLKSNTNVLESMESGDFEMMGKDLETLQSWIEKLKSAREKELKEKDENKNVVNEVITNETNTTNSVFVID